MAEWKSASWKQEEDHSIAATELLERVNATTVPVLLRSTNNTLDFFLEEVLAVEKKARFGGDTISTLKLAVEVIKICRTQNEIEAMFTHLEVLMKKRGQMKQVQSGMMNEAANALTVEGEHKLSPEAHVSLLERLKHLAEGKLHLELEHARYTMALAATVVAAGRKREASDLLAGVQIETITSMPRLEKLECILDQIQLTLDIEEPSRTAVLSRKINPRALGKEDTKELKVKYFTLMIEHYKRSADVSTLLIARCWHEIFLTVPEFAAAKDDDSDAVAFQGITHLQALGNTIMYALLASHVSTKEITEAAECVAFSKESAQIDRAEWLAELLKHKDVRNELPTLEGLLKAFTGVELIHTTLVSDVTQICESHGIPERTPELVSRLSEHDILVVAKYYKRIGLKRLAELVGLGVGPTEQFIMSMVSTKSIYAKIDRIDEVVVFQKAPTPVDVEAQWNKGVDQIASLVDRMCHLISKERMLSSAGVQ